MNKILLTTILLLGSSAALAEEPVITLQKVPCTQWKFVVHNLTTVYQEIPFSQSDSAMTLPNGQNLVGKLVMFVNPNTKSFSAVMRLGPEPESMACIIAAGENFAPAKDQEYKDIRGDIES